MLKMTNQPAVKVTTPFGIMENAGTMSEQVAEIIRDKNRKALCDDKPSASPTPKVATPQNGGVGQSKPASETVPDTNEKSPETKPADDFNPDDFEGGI